MKKNLLQLAGFYQYLPDAMLPAQMNPLK